MHRLLAQKPIIDFMPCLIFFITVPSLDLSFQLLTVPVDFRKLVVSSVGIWESSASRMMPISNGLPGSTDQIAALSLTNFRLAQDTLAEMQAGLRVQQSAH